MRQVRGFKGKARGVGGRGLALVGLSLLTAVAGAVPAWSAGGSLDAAGQARTARCAPGVPGDVNGDGFAEVAVGEPDNDGGRGSVHLFYGQRSGVVYNATGSARNDEYLTQDTPGVPGTAEAGDRFGSVTALADVNGDRCADLVVGSPGENAGTGWLHVFYGSPVGLSTHGVGSFGMNALFGAGSAAADQGLGDSVAVGDLNGDGIEDVAAGVMGLDVGGQQSAGGVAVMSGSTHGLNAGRDVAVLVTRDTPGIPGAPVELDGFGAAVAAGDFDGDGAGEVAVGMTNGLSTGAVQVVHRTATGFQAGEPIGPTTAGMPGEADQFCAFGFVLASGDVHGDGPDDLVVADPAFGCHDPGRPDYGSGVVVLLPGSARGLTTSDSQLWTQDSPGVDGAERLGNLFGEALAMGPLDRGDTADLAIGAPGDGTGSVTVLLGGAKGLSTAGIGGTRYTQATPGIVGTAEAGDRFGDTVTTAPVQNQSQASLIIGVPGEDVGSVTDAGSVTQLSISRTGPDPRGSRTFTANTPGVKGKAGRFDHFGDSTHHWG